MTFKNVYFGFYLISIFLFSCSETKNMLLVSPVFSDHMVLQQQAEVPLWGSGTPGESIEVISSWGEVSNSEVQNNGSWTAVLKTPKFGGPFEVKVRSGSNEIVFDDVFNI
jgi:sialate O-acetylesterase